MSTEISIQSIQATLQEAAGNIPLTVKMDSKMDVTSAVRFMDNQIIVRLKPGRLTKRAHFDEVIEYLVKLLLEG